ncbi:MAG: tRNA preQ1(34) S-adenosylmethionine ribosyltransferase-isomerase QueA [Thermodesulfobacteriota bacterium]
MFDLEAYDYDLPEHLIAQAPAEKRDQSRLLVVDRSGESLSDRFFFDLPLLLRSGDLLVVNNTRVVPARLFGRKESGGKAEVLVLEHESPGHDLGCARWCLVKSSKRPGVGHRLLFDRQMSGIVERVEGGGLTRLVFQGPFPIDLFLQEAGVVPLPPYIRRNHGDDRAVLDRERYQTIFSRPKGSVAAPTAGLHFSEELIRRLNESGVKLVEVTLHVGYGTFKPVRTRDIRKHRIGEEGYAVDGPAADGINEARLQGRRVIAVGTTVVRVLETVAREGGFLKPGEGRTDLLITPGHPFKIVDGLITNFHLPRSSLLFLVSAFAGIERIRRAYRWAVERAYRFYSYGDAMLIL